MLLKVCFAFPKDGTSVPTTIYHRKSLEELNIAPMFTTVYGKHLHVSFSRFCPRTLVSEANAKSFPILNTKHRIISN